MFDGIVLLGLNFFSNVFLSLSTVDCVHNQAKYRPSRVRLYLNASTLFDTSSEMKVTRIPSYTYIRKCKYKNVGKQIQTQILATKVCLYLNTRALFDTRRRSCSSDTAGVHIASTMKLPNKPQDLDHVFFTINTSLSFHVLSLIQLIFVVYSHVEDFRWLRSVCCHFASALP